MRVLQKLLLGAVLSFGISSAAHAAVVDLISTFVGTATSSYGNAIFTGSFQRSTGTGVIDPFLSIQATNTEHGYNTSGGNVLDTKRSPQYSRNLQLQDLITYNIGSTEYYIFVIDINESNSAANSKISWDSLQIYTSPIGSQTTTNVSSLGVLRWDLEDNTIIYDDLNSGSGQGDIAFLIPTASFLSGPNAALPTDYVYMYQAFGGYAPLYRTEGGFEETYLGVGITPFIPEVSTALPIAMVLGGLFLFGSRHQRRREVPQTL